MKHIVVPDETPPRQPAGFSTRQWIVRMRPLARFETSAVKTVFEGMSMRSRYQRFHAFRLALPPATLHSLSDVDGDKHGAIVAEVRKEGRWTPVGIARYASVGDRRAEVAVEVVDDWQGRGVGSALTEEITRAAKAQRFTELHADVLSENQTMLHIIAKLWPRASMSVGPFVRTTVSLEKDGVAA